MNPTNIYFVYWGDDPDDILGVFTNKWSSQCWAACHFDLSEVTRYRMRDAATYAARHDPTEKIPSPWV